MIYMHEVGPNLAKGDEWCNGSRGSMGVTHVPKEWEHRWQEAK